MKRLLFLLTSSCALVSAGRADASLSRAEYLDRVEAVWTGQILATMIGFPFENRTASVVPVHTLPLIWKAKPATFAPVDDDWYYEMAAVRAFEKFGVGLTVQQLGEVWREHRCGSWGSSEQARLAMERGIQPPDTGHPRYNKQWFTIGPQFSADVYGALAPGLPNVAGRLARELGRINGHAEGLDGGVFIATLVSLGFVERDPRVIVRRAAAVVHPSSPYRQCIDTVIRMADEGRSFAEIVSAVEDRWHIEYPVPNNAVANGGIVAAGLWFGRGEFWPTVDLICGASDFSDADCNAANAAAVIGAMHGMKALPAAFVAQLNDRIVGAEMGRVVFAQPVNESITGLARRTADIGEKILAAEAVRREGGRFVFPAQQIATQPAERFTIGDLTKFWNPEWTLERAGLGGANVGVVRNRGATYLEGDILVTYPRDESRAVVLWRKARLGSAPKLVFEVGAEAARAWELDVFAENVQLEKHTIVGEPGKRKWQTITVDLKDFAGREITLRLYQRVMLRTHSAGSALWRNLRIE